jgi:hypothetical protein
MVRNCTQVTDNSAPDGYNVAAIVARIGPGRVVSPVARLGFICWGKPR